MRNRKKKVLVCRRCEASFSGRGSGRYYCSDLCRLMHKVAIEATGCWTWIAARDSEGYGHFLFERQAQTAHRVAYRLLVGPIPEGLHLDHLCRNRACVNPAHLEPVTPAENVRRGFSPSTANREKTHCKRGHEFTPENTYVYRGHRSCRACQRETVARYKARLAEAAS